MFKLQTVFLIAGYAATAVFSATNTSNLEFLAILGAHGDTPPSTIFEIPTKESEDPFRSHLGLTNLALRQQYLIGQELRERYVEEENFLAPSYRINEIYIRTAGHPESFVSAHAQMIGLYPPSSCDLELNEW
jgi:hypothetical protein